MLDKNGQESNSQLLLEEFCSDMPYLKIAVITFVYNGLDMLVRL